MQMRFLRLLHACYDAGEVVGRVWQLLWLECARQEIPLFMHVSDGDPRLRSATLRLCLKRPGQPWEALSIDHPLSQMWMLKVISAKVSWACCGCC